MQGFLLSTFLVIFGLSDIAQAQQSYVQGEVIVKLKGRSGNSTSQKFMGKLGLRKLNVKMSFHELNIHSLKLQQNRPVDEVVAELKADPDVEYVEPNYILSKFDDQATAPMQAMSKDEVLNTLASGQDSEAYSENYVSGSYAQTGASVKATQAWAQLSNTPDRPIVAVIDTGVDLDHDVFVESNAIWTNPGEIAGNGIDDDHNGYVDDLHGWNFNNGNNNPDDNNNHGTHVAGIVLGATQDILASQLSEAKIQIMALKFLGSDGSGSTSDAINAIYYAVRNGAQVINNSWGGSNYSQSLHEAMKYAYDNRVVVVSAAGNNASNNDSIPTFPSSYPIPGHISVAASSSVDYLAYFSNYGASSVSIAGPGTSVYSTITANRWASMQGTSMASPFVAGVAALVVREAPNLSAYQVKNVILNTSDYKTQLTSKVLTAGRVNVLNAVLGAQSDVNVLAEQPDYSAVNVFGSAGREPASEAAPKGGCGLVKALSEKAPPANGSSPIGMVLALSLLPVIAWYVMRARAESQDGINRRKYERFAMDSAFKIKINGRELTGQMKTISMGGLSFNADTMLEKGGLITMKIASPSGNEEIEVQGRVVWSEENKSYGVQFSEVQEKVSNWVQGSKVAHQKV